jgi:hypothetical protein
MYLINSKMFEKRMKECPYKYCKIIYKIKLSNSLVLSWYCEHSHKVMAFKTAVNSRDKLVPNCI